MPSLDEREPPSTVGDSLTTTILEHVPDQAARRFAQALEMHEAGRQMYRMRLCREHPEWSSAAVEDAVMHWLAGGLLTPGRPGSDERWMRLTGHPAPRRS